MEIDVLKVIGDNGLILLFLVIGLGYLIGNLKLFGVPVGPTIGVLLVGLFFGHHGLSMSPAVGTFGFALFIFSVGLQAGPSFFSAFLEDGKKYILLAAFVALTGLGTAIALSELFGFAPGFNAGLMAGALTSTPTLAAAQDAVNNGLAGGDAETRQQIIENIGVGYALTYLVGTILVILVIRYAPRIMKMNLEPWPGPTRKTRACWLAYAISRRPPRRSRSCGPTGSRQTRMAKRSRNEMPNCQRSRAWS